MNGDIWKLACEAVFFSTQERFSTLTVLNDLNSHEERTAQFAPLSPPPASKGVVSGPRTWKTAPRALGNAMMAQDAFLSLVRDFPKNFARIIVQKSMFKAQVEYSRLAVSLEFLNTLMHSTVGKWSQNFCPFVFPPETEESSYHRNFCFRHEVQRTSMINFEIIKPKLLCANF